jgi:hypothetical protein
LAALPKRIETIQQRIAAIEADIAVRQNVSGNRFAIEIEGKRHTDRTEAGKAILHAVHGVRYGSERVIGRLAGFPIVVKAAEIREFGKRLLIRGGIDYEAGRRKPRSASSSVGEHAAPDGIGARREREHLARRKSAWPTS